jgi:hypothetical protein
MNPFETHRFRGAALALLALLAAGCGDRPPASVRAAPGGHRVGDAQRFASAPSLHPAAVEVTRAAHDAAPGDVFAAPRPGQQAGGGPMIFDDAGQLVWYRPLPAGRQAIDFSLQHYRGRPVLTWGERPLDSHAGAEVVVADSRYHTLARVRAGDGDGTDLHDFEITAHDTALVIGYRIVPYDLTAVGGPAGGFVLDGTIQEIDIPTGRVLWRWSALDHVPVTESSARVAPSEPYDAYHLNSVDQDADGNLLISARHTSTLYKVDRRTGAILWRLGGRSGEFDVAAGAAFAFQHDARWGPDGTVTVFDNGAVSGTRRETESRGKRLALDTAAHRATLVAAYARPQPLSSESQGTFQTLPDGHAFIGWGKEPIISEFAADGRELFEARFPTGDQQSYSARRYVWTGTPTTRPAVTARRAGGAATLRASWNGATEVARWQVLGGSRGTARRPLGTARRAGFETVLTVRTRRRYLAVRALDADGRVLATSRTVGVR